MHSGGHSATPSPFPSPASTGRGEANPRALSANREDIEWLLEKRAVDPARDLGSSVSLAVAADCVRARLLKDHGDDERERSERERASGRRLAADRVAQAVLIRELGMEGAKARVRELQARGAPAEDASGRLMYRFRRMIERVFEYFQVKGMRMEPFQLELFRGVVLGVTKAQFGDSLFRHKHALLSALGLEPLGSESYDHTNPALSHLYRVEKEFSRCSEPAQNKNMCTTLRVGVERAMEELQQLPSFDRSEKILGMCGNPENRTYTLDRATRDASVIHFLSSSNGVSVISFSFAVLLPLLTSSSPFVLRPSPFSFSDSLPLPLSLTLSLTIEWDLKR
ncbi:hypothetical protein Q5P01_000804 [Channa striata]|uniref:Uncharacterized protein n=1 Tax=Channa striata TaxID=64152 RepID=A0AA88IRI1_CHASR|nr:hypothetical protein Q5P01_000804 [Channa striata]